MAAENFKVKKGLEVGTGTTITSSGINVSGIITATQLVGDGSGLTNVVGSGSGIVVKDEGSAVGTAGTINFVGSGVVASLAAGQATVTISSGGLNDVVGDTTPQLGGNLDLNSKFITGSGGINVTGVVTATTLKGNGDFVDIDVDGNTELDNVSIAGITTISGTTPILDFTETDGDPDYRLTVDSGLFKIRNLLSGTYTSIFTINTDGHVDIAGNTDFAAGIDVTGNATFVNDIDVDGHTELDDLNVTGVSTFNNDVTFTGDNYDLMWDKTDDSLEFADNTFAVFGGQGDLKIRHNTTVTPHVSQITNAASSQLEIVADNLELRSGTGDKSYLSANVGGATTLFYNDQQKLTTTGTGIEVPDLSVTGVGTIGQIETDGITLGTNATTFAAKFADNAVANFGTDNDLKIYHNDTSGFFINSKGQTRFENTDGNISIFASDSNGDIIMRAGGDQSTENAIVAVHHGEVVLSCNGATRITTTNAGATVAGTLSATTFSGSGASLTNLPSAQLTGALPSLDGSALTGITGSGSGVVVQHDGSNVGTAGTINFSTNLDVTAIHAGIVTVTASGGGAASTAFVSAQTLNVVGVSSFNSDVRLIGNQPININDNAIQIRGNNGGNGFITNAVGDLYISNVTGTLHNDATNNFSVKTNGTEQAILATKNGSVALYHDGGNKKLETSSTGVTITGALSATSFSGSGASITNLTGASSGTYGNASAVPVITVDGNGRITGISTVAGSGSGISNVVDDTSPQLGGNLDVQSREINTSATNGNIKLTPNGTGCIEVKGAGGNDGTIQLNCSANSHGVKIKSPPHSAAATYTLTLPTNIVNGQFLKTDGSGNLSWAASGTASRTTTNASTGSISQTSSANITIPTPGKTFSLLKVAISAPAYVILYTDSTSRSNDASRSEGTDPTPGSGVLTEVSTTTSGASTFLMTPAVLGWNNDSTPANQIYAKVVNKRATSGSNAITVTLTSVALES